MRTLAAGVYAAAGKRDLAPQQLVAAQKLAPDNLEVAIGLGKLDLAQGNPKEAEASFKRALDKDPKHLVATLGMAAAAGARKDACELREVVTSRPVVITRIRPRRNWRWHSPTSLRRILQRPKRSWTRRSKRVPKKCGACECAWAHPAGHAGTCRVRRPVSPKLCGSSRPLAITN